MASSSLGDFLNAMVALRRQKASEQEYNASQRMAGMEALGQGIGGLMSNYASGRRQSAKDAMQTRMDEMSLALDRQKLNQGSIEDPLANQMRNQMNPPRALAMTPGMQTAADLAPLPGQISYQDQPINPTVATGGAQGLKNYLDLSKPEDLDKYRRAQLAIKEEREQRLRAQAEAKATKTAQDLTARAATSMSKAGDQYKKKVGETTTYNNHVALTTHNMATAKSDEDWQKNVDLITNHYNAMTALGYELPFPEIPPAPSQREAAAAATQSASDLTPTTGGSFPYWHPFAGSSQEQIDAAKAAAANMPGSYQYPGMHDYERATPGEPPSGNLQDYMAQPGPSQAASQGPAPSAATPAGGGGAITIPEAAAQKYNPALRSGDSFTSKGKTYYVQ